MAKPDREIDKKHGFQALAGPQTVERMREDIAHFREGRDAAISERDELRRQLKVSECKIGVLKELLEQAGSVIHLYDGHESDSLETCKQGIPCGKIVAAIGGSDDLRLVDRMKAMFNQKPPNPWPKPTNPNPEGAQDEASS